MRHVTFLCLLYDLMNCFARNCFPASLLYAVRSPSIYADNGQIGSFSAQFMIHDLVRKLVTVVLTHCRTLIVAQNRFEFLGDKIIQFIVSQAPCSRFYHSCYIQYIIILFLFIHIVVMSGVVDLRS